MSLRGVPRRQQSTSSQVESWSFKSLVEAHLPNQAPSDAFDVHIPQTKKLTGPKHINDILPINIGSWQTTWKTMVVSLMVVSSLDGNTVNFFPVCNDHWSSWAPFTSALKESAGSIQMKMTCQRSSALVFTLSAHSLPSVFLQGRHNSQHKEDEWTLSETI